MIGDQLEFCSFLTPIPSQLLILAPPADGLWQALDLPRKVTAWSGVVWDDAMNVDWMGTSTPNVLTVTFVHPIDVVKTRIDTHLLHS